MTWWEISIAKALNRQERYWRAMKERATSAVDHANDNQRRHSTCAESLIHPRRREEKKRTLSPMALQNELRLPPHHRLATCRYF